MKSSSSNSNNTNNSVGGGGTIIKRISSATTQQQHKQAATFAQQQQQRLAGSNSDINITFPSALAPLEPCTAVVATQSDASFAVDSPQNLESSPPSSTILAHQSKRVTQEHGEISDKIFIDKAIPTAVRFQAAPAHVIRLSTSYDAAVQSTGDINPSANCFSDSHKNVSSSDVDVVVVMNNNSTSLRNSSCDSSKSCLALTLKNGNAKSTSPVRLRNSVLRSVEPSVDSSLEAGPPIHGVATPSTNSKSVSSTSSSILTSSNSSPKVVRVDGCLVEARQDSTDAGILENCQHLRCTNELGNSSARSGIMEEKLMAANFPNNGVIITNPKVDNLGKFSNTSNTISFSSNSNQSVLPNHSIGDSISHPMSLHSPQYTSPLTTCI